MSLVEDRAADQTGEEATDKERRFVDLPAGRTRSSHERHLLSLSEGAPIIV